jgi:hypothetical protein
MTETKTNIERLLTHLKDGSLAHKLASAAKDGPSRDQLTDSLKQALAQRAAEIRDQFNDRDD